MKIKKTRFSTMISDLYGRNNYYKGLKTGREYWWNWPYNSVIGEKYGAGWYKIKITFIRSRCMFYIFTDYPDIPEQFCGFDCFLASSLILADLNPIMDLPDVSKNLEYSKTMYCFDDDHTVIHNWDNSREIEVNDEEIYNKFGNTSEYLIIMCNKE